LLVNFLQTNTDPAYRQQLGTNLVRLVLRWEAERPKRLVPEVGLETTPGIDTTQVIDSSNGTMGTNSRFGGFSVQNRVRSLAEKHIPKACPLRALLKVLLPVYGAEVVECVAAAFCESPLVVDVMFFRIVLVLAPFEVASDYLVA
jgi:hypothetical protein